MNKPKMQGTAFESWLVKWLDRIEEVTEPRRIAEGGSKDIGDVEWEDYAGDIWIAECKATQTLNVTRVLGKARAKSGRSLTTVLFWKRLTKLKPGQERRSSDGEPVVIVMALDTFKMLMADR